MARTLKAASTPGATVTLAGCEVIVGKTARGATLNKAAWLVLGPSGLLTITRSRAPSSPPLAAGVAEVLASASVRCVAPGRSAQVVPASLLRCHW